MTAKVGADDFIASGRGEDFPRLPRTPLGQAVSAPVEATALLARTYDEPPGIIAGGILPRQGLAVIGGPPKRGKSLLLLQQALAAFAGQLSAYRDRLTRRLEEWSRPGGAMAGGRVEVRVRRPFVMTAGGDLPRDDKGQIMRANLVAGLFDGRGALMNRGEVVPVLAEAAAALVAEGLAEAVEAP